MLLIMTIISPKQFINHEAGNDEAWLCLCGNRPDSDGFFTCDGNGDEMEPALLSNWDGLYVCGRCGRIVQQTTLEIVGMNPNFKRLDRID